MRKIPTQARSLQTVDFIAEATVQVLDKSRKPRFTTNHVAERAGVSIGTLYRYFPDKNVLLTFIVRRELEQSSRAVTKIVGQSRADCAHDLLGEGFAIANSIFMGRRRATRNIRLLVESDTTLREEIRQTRVRLLTHLYDRLMQLEPERFKPLSQTQIAAANDAFQAAKQRLETSNRGEAIETATQARLINAILHAFTNT